LLSKETFCKVLSLVQEQSEIDDRFSDALRLVGDGHFVFGAGNKYMEALLLVLKEAVGDKYDYTSWWLYETDNYRVWSVDEDKEWNLRSPEALYDYIIEANAQEEGEEK